MFRAQNIIKIIFESMVIGFTITVTLYLIFNNYNIQVEKQHKLKSKVFFFPSYFVYLLNVFSCFLLFLFFVTRKYLKFSSTVNIFPFTPSFYLFDLPPPPHPSPVPFDVVGLLFNHLFVFFEFLIS
jgi:hypothetical protein